MNPPPAAERALYSDLNRLLHELRGESYAKVEAAIEARFHAYLRAHAAGRSANLEITHVMTVHDEAEPWAMYRTEYRVTPATPLADVVPPPPAAAYANVIPFPNAFRAPSPAAAVLQESRRPGTGS